MIRVGFSTTTNILSRLIRKISGGKMSHAWLLLEAPFYGQDKWVLEAVEGGFHLTPFAGYTTGHVLVDILDVDHPLDDGVAKAMTWLGTHYDYTGLFGAAFVMIQRWLKARWRWLTFKVHNPLHEPRAMYCSAAVVYVLQAAAFPNADKLVPDTTTPQDLYDFLKSGVIPEA